MSPSPVSPATMALSVVFPATSTGTGKLEAMALKVLLPPSPLSAARTRET